MHISSVLLGALFAGIITGAIPAICGAVKNKIGLAIGGFFACVVSSLILGLLLAIPVCALFLWLIFREDKSNKDIPDKDIPDKDTSKY